MKKLPIRPLLSIATICVAPAVMAQSADTTTNTPAATTTRTSLGADSANVFQLRAGIGYEHDSNVLRQPTATADNIVTGLVGLKFDKRYGLQRFRGDVEFDAFKFQDQSSLDYNTLNYNAAWDWSVTPRVHGVISADRKQYRETFADVLTGVNRVGRRTERNEVAEGIYELGAAWRVLAGVAHNSSKSTQPGSWDASPSVNSAHVGVGYELASGASITGRFRRGDGEYTDPSAAAAAGDFRDNETSVLVKWPITTKTAVEATAGHLSRKHSGAPQRDVSGVVGHAPGSWERTGKTRLLAGVAHNLSATGLATGGHVESNQFWIAPVWKPTVHTAVNLRYDHTKRTWEDVPGGSPDFGRNEKVQAVQLGVDWEPRPAYSVGAYVRNERLKSSLFFSGYRANIYGVNAKVYF